MTRANSHYLVLSIYPTSRGYAFVLFEGPLNVYDWGMKEIRKNRKNEATLKSISGLIERYRPEHILMEDYNEPGSRRSSRIKKLYRMITDLAESECIGMSYIPHDSILTCFASVEAKTKHEIAKAIAQQIPALAHRLPRLRKIWMSEDPRQSLFDAAALGVVFYTIQSGKFAPE
ncbi:MAG: hypothetical protein ACLQHK_05810 [Gallionellaceae bacterium]